MKALPIHWKQADKNALRNITETLWNITETLGKGNVTFLEIPCSSVPRQTGRPAKLREQRWWRAEDRWTTRQQNAAVSPANHNSRWCQPAALLQCHRLLNCPPRHCSEPAVRRPSWQMTARSAAAEHPAGWTRSSHHSWTLQHGYQQHTPAQLR